jgi:hypothetical protein
MAGVAPNGSAPANLVLQRMYTAVRPVLVQRPPPFDER